MKSVRKWIRDIFGFSGNEINGFLVLLPLMLVLVISEPVYRRWSSRRAAIPDSRSFDSLMANWTETTEPLKEIEMPMVTLFRFDPNTASVDDLRKLGIDGIIANRIAAYRRKGGVFRIKSDMKRIYGLDSALYHQLYSYVALPETLPEKSATSPERSRAGRYPFPSGRKSREAEQKFDINTADTLQLESVYGIGPKLAARIIKFRDGLGGFVRQEQLAEVYGLDSATVAQLAGVSFIREEFIPRKIDINTATEDTMSRHPYINNRLARMLVIYRFQHGDFREVNDIKKLSTLKTGELDRLLPYLTVEK